MEGSWSHDRLDLRFRGSEPPEEERGRRRPAPEPRNFHTTPSRGACGKASLEAVRTVARRSAGDGDSMSVYTGGRRPRSTETAGESAGESVTSGVGNGSAGARSPG
ncbi:hypothetical protein [Nonomuraea sp. NPDC049709]|uniref:hypothetical protein n=1 Tax=Nonomuraea sp. NPDC049709 TaxID=3154736 RepID=UPI00342EAFD2